MLAYQVLKAFLLVLLILLEVLFGAHLLVVGIWLRVLLLSPDLDHYVFVEKDVQKLMQKPFNAQLKPETKKLMSSEFELT